jgi:hypothetical protein
LALIEVGDDPADRRLSQQGRQVLISSCQLKLWSLAAELSGDGDLEYFIDGMTHELTDLGMPTRVRIRTPPTNIKSDLEKAGVAHSDAFAFYTFQESWKVASNQQAIVRPIRDQT